VQLTGCISPLLRSSSIKRHEGRGRRKWHRAPAQHWINADYGIEVEVNSGIMNGD
jgi:hypothetical protein